jgi:hypothetical protein
MDAEVLLPSSRLARRSYEEIKETLYVNTASDRPAVRPSLCLRPGIID